MPTVDWVLIGTMVSVMVFCWRVIESQRKLIERQADTLSRVTDSFNGAMKESQKATTVSFEKVVSGMQEFTKSVLFPPLPPIPKDEEQPAPTHNGEVIWPDSDKPKENPNLQERLREEANLES